MQEYDCFSEMHEAGVKDGHQRNCELYAEFYMCMLPMRWPVILITTLGEYISIKRLKPVVQAQVG